MNERLKLAKELLKDDGVIFVSIDDTEQAYLKVLMDEIFGEENFVCNFIWRNKNTGGGSDKNGIDIETEFILCYSKNKEKVIFSRQEIISENYKYIDEYFKERGKYNLIDLDHVSSKSSFKYSESLDYEIEAPDGTFFKNYRNIIKPRSYSYTLGKNTFDFANKNGFIEIIKKKDKDGNEYWKAYRKSYEKVKIDNKKLEIIPREEGNNFNNLINEGNITTSSGKRMLINVLENKDFAFPKPIELLKIIINFKNNKNARVLDFFAGSGTTAHAVLELNREDGGNRTFTLVTNNENNIGIDVNYERLYRINHGIGTKGEAFEWTNKNEPYKSNLNVFKLEYFDVSPNNLDINVKELTNKLINVLKEFGITSIDQNNEQEYINLLNDLSSLKPLEKENNESN
ncbi:type III restriction-modification system: methylase [Mycoplasmopsis maculosa]|uniref:Type III restriction-modification system: methylase n=2 Tax=Mycoplasmopsis maculosa TaxID=114885 RepID=A0A449B4B5_9BACT|nr:type III restriction-modification system: methylase [Mycoplasmopsis maculosa]